MKRYGYVLLALALISVASTAPAQVGADGALGSGSIIVSDASPYFENFEAGAGGWTSPGLLWELGTPSQTAIASAFSGTNAWMTDLDANYIPSTPLDTLEASFDFSGLTSDPVFSFQIQYQTEADWDGVQVRIDTGAGFQTLGSVNDPSWYNNTSVQSIGSDADGFSGINGGYERAAQVLTGTAGLPFVAIQFVFSADSTVFDEGVAIDDIAIYPAVVVADASPYSEDFEAGPGAWSTGGTLWEHGTPMQTIVSGAHSGVNAWMTDLDANYFNNANETVGVRVNALGLSRDPVFSMWINHNNEQASPTTTPWDGFQVQVDTGNGFAVLGGLGEGINWYESANVVGLGGPGWGGTSAGWEFVAIVIPGTAGKVFDLRVRFGSDGSVTREGSAFDDVFIGGLDPIYPGTGEDLTLAGATNFGALIANTGLFDVLPVSATDYVTLHLDSPSGTFLAGNYSVLATPYDHQAGLVPEVIFPAALVGNFPGLADANLYVSMNTVQFIGSAAGNTSLNIPALLPPGGVSMVFQFPAMLEGNDYLFQGIVSGTNTNNAFYAATSGVVLDSTSNSVNQ
ncbi:MAG: hypothetical protein KDB53_07300 [Planctomycetes bacterium]|nr:hypothetical protein [Planctomycetota bacterium]